MSSANWQSALFLSFDFATGFGLMNQLAYRIFLGSLLLLATGNLTLAQTAKPTVPRSAGQEINEWVTYSEKELLGMAEDMPEEKYNFAPTNGEFRGVRSFGKQVKHTTAAMQLITAAILGAPIPAEMADRAPVACDCLGFIRRVSFDVVFKEFNRFWDRHGSRFCFDSFDRLSAICK